MVVSTGNSQLDFIDALVLSHDLDWTAVEALHLDEYAGMPPTHPASFRLWLRNRLAARVLLRAMHYVNGDAPDLQAECRRYGALLAEAPIDAGFIGIGENGHIGFNDPPVADFHDPVPIKVVRLDDACRRQQVGEGHFESIAAVPEHALSLTCPAIVGMTSLICCVPGTAQGPSRARRHHRPHRRLPCPHRFCERIRAPACTWTRNRPRSWRAERCRPRAGNAIMIHIFQKGSL